MSLKDYVAATTGGNEDEPTVDTDMKKLAQKIAQLQRGGHKAEAAEYLKKYGGQIETAYLKAAGVQMPKGKSLFGQIKQRAGSVASPIFNAMGRPTQVVQSVLRTGGVGMAKLVHDTTGWGHEVDTTNAGFGQIGKAFAGQSHLTPWSMVGSKYSGAVDALTANGAPTSGVAGFGVKLVGGALDLAASAAYDPLMYTGGSLGGMTKSAEAGFKIMRGAEGIGETAVQAIRKGGVKTLGEGWGTAQTAIRESQQVKNMAKFARRAPEGEVALAASAAKKAEKIITEIERGGQKGMRMGGKTIIPYGDAAPLKAIRRALGKSRTGEALDLVKSATTASDEFRTKYGELVYQAKHESELTMQGAVTRGTKDIALQGRTLEKAALEKFPQAERDAIATALDTGTMDAVRPTLSKEGADLMDGLAELRSNNYADLGKSWEVDQGVVQASKTNEDLGRVYDDEFNRVSTELTGEAEAAVVEARATAKKVFEAEHSHLVDEARAPLAKAEADLAKVRSAPATDAIPKARTASKKVFEREHTRLLDEAQAPLQAAKAELKQARKEAEELQAVLAERKAALPKDRPASAAASRFVGAAEQRARAAGSKVTALEAKVVRAKAAADLAMAKAGGRASTIAKQELAKVIKKDAADTARVLREAEKRVAAAKAVADKGVAGAAGKALKVVQPELDRTLIATAKKTAKIPDSGPPNEIRFPSAPSRPGGPHGETYTSARPLTSAQHANPYADIPKDSVRLFRGESAEGVRTAPAPASEWDFAHADAGSYFTGSYEHAQQFAGPGGTVYGIDVPPSAAGQWGFVKSARVGGRIDEASEGMRFDVVREAQQAGIHPPQSDGIFAPSNAERVVSPGVSPITKKALEAAAAARDKAAKAGSFLKEESTYLPHNVLTHAGGKALRKLKRSSPELYTQLTGDLSRLSREGSTISRAAGESLEDTNAAWLKTFNDKGIKIKGAAIELDPTRLVAVSGRRGLEAVEEIKHIMRMSKIDRGDGVPLIISGGDDVAKRAAAAGYGRVPGTKFVGDIYASKETIKELGKLNHVIENDETLRHIGVLLKDINGLWAQNATTFNAAKRYLGDIFNNALDGVTDPGVYRLGAKMQSADKAVQKEIGRAAGPEWEAAIIEKLGKTDGELYIYAIEDGVTSSGLLSGDVQNRFADLVKGENSKWTGKKGTGLVRRASRNKIMDVGARTSRFEEDNVRLANYIHNMRKTGDRSISTQHVQQFLFDYSELSPTEVALKNVSRFYTYMRKNTPLQVKMMLDQPGIYSFASKAHGTLSSLAPGSAGAGLSPDYTVNRGDIPFFGNMIQTDSPLADAFSKLDPLVQTVAMLPGIGKLLPKEVHPEGGSAEVLRGFLGMASGGTVSIATAAVEQMTGKSLFTGAPLSKNDKNLAFKFVKVLLPELSKLGPITNPKGGNVPMQMLGKLLGLGVLPVNEKSMNREVTRRLHVAEDIIDKAKQNGEVIPAQQDLIDAGLAPNQATAKKILAAAGITFAGPKPKRTDAQRRADAMAKISA